MKKACIVVSTFYQNNRLFDINNKLVNRDGCMYPFYLLKEKFNTKGYDLSTQDINSVVDSEIVIYNDISKRLPRRNEAQKSYLIIFESELIRPDNWEIEKHKYFHKIFTWKDDIIDNKKYFKLNFAQNIKKNIIIDLFQKKKLCTLIAGNRKSYHPLELYSKRREAIEWFETNHPNDFDLYGFNWDKYVSANKYINFVFEKLGLSNLIYTPPLSYKGRVDIKIKILKRYKFAICYENARDIPGYITEKIFDCFLAACVPIYWGASNIAEHIPKDSFIDKRNFESYSELYTFLSNMSDNTYMEYLYNIERYLNSSDVYQYSSEFFANQILKNVL